MEWEEERLQATREASITSVRIGPRADSGLEQKMQQII